MRIPTEAADAILSAFIAQPYLIGGLVLALGLASIVAMYRLISQLIAVLAKVAGGLRRIAGRIVKSRRGSQLQATVDVLIANNLDDAWEVVEGGERRGRVVREIGGGNTPVA